MGNFFTLYKLEIKKTVSKRSLWIAMAVGIVLVLLFVFTNLSADGHSVYVKNQEKELIGISGEKMDQEFFEEFDSEVNAEIEKNRGKYEKLYAYDEGSVYMNAAGAIGKQALYDLIYDVVRDRNRVKGITEVEFYDCMRSNIISDAKSLGSDDDEILAWMKTFDSMEKPMEYNYSLPYFNILDNMFIIGWILFINISIALAGVFSDEKMFRTDAMILSTKNGRAKLCRAKIMAGITVAVSEAFILLSSLFTATFCFYGASGWNAAVQNILPASPWNITVGNMFILYFILALVICVLFAMTNMVFSYFTKSSAVTMAIHVAFLFAGLFGMPRELGLFSKLWEIRPTMILHYGTFCNTFMYGRLNNVEMSVSLCLAASVILTVILSLLYRKSQAESR